MHIRNLNLNSLVVFASVYRSGGMTMASKELAMTQPGVTQHIRALESSLDLKLFFREGKRLIPTKEAEILYKGVLPSLEEMEEVLASLTERDRQFRGTVGIGVPIEFGNTKILPHLSKIRARFPYIQFHITYGLPHELNSLLLEGKLDFAFIDQYQINSVIKTKEVYQENLVLCCSKDYFRQMPRYRVERAYFEKLDILAYQQGAPIVRNWLERAFGFKKLKLSIASYSFDVTGVSTLVQSSMGVGVLPEHVFNRIKEGGVELHQFRSRTGPVTNPISLAYTSQRWEVPLNQFVIQMLSEMLG